MEQVCQEKRKTDFLEALAELEHTQWWEWSTTLVDHEEHISKSRIERWSKLWRPYRELSEEEKDLDRVWAEKVLWVVKKHLGIK